MPRSPCSAASTSWRWIPSPGSCAARVKIIALDARRVNVYGVKASIVEDLVEHSGASSWTPSAPRLQHRDPGALEGKRHRSPPSDRAR